MDRTEGTASEATKSGSTPDEKELRLGLLLQKIVSKRKRQYYHGFMLGLRTNDL